MSLALPPRTAVDPPQEFWFRRPDDAAPIQEVVSVKHAEELLAKGWELLSVGPLRAATPQDAPAPQAEFYVEPEPVSEYDAPDDTEAEQAAALATGVQE